MALALWGEGSSFLYSLPTSELTHPTPSAGTCGGNVSSSFLGVGFGSRTDLFASAGSCSLSIGTVHCNKRVRNWRLWRNLGPSRWWSAVQW